LIGKVVIGTRGSRLAVIQTQMVADRISPISGDVEIIIKKISTSGDKDKTSILGQVEAVGFFVKELESALSESEIDLAVHSLKDMPAIQPEGLTIAAVLEREDPRDVLVSKGKRLDELAAGDKVGTSSLRRQVQLKRMRPDLLPLPIRGNIDTRIAKLDRGEYSAVVMAAAALLRLSWEERIVEFLPEEHFVPAGGQGAIAVEARQNDRDLLDLMAELNHLQTWQSVVAERAFLHNLGAGCHAPVGALAVVNGEKLTLKIMVASADGSEVVYDEVQGKAAQAESIGVELARKMKARGAPDFL